MRVPPLSAGVFAVCHATSLFAQSADARPAGHWPEAIVPPATLEAQEVLDRLRLPDGLVATYGAAEPSSGDVVRITRDERGRLFLAPTPQARTSPLDVRVYERLLGRDLNGIAIGPDGRLYLSVGAGGIEATEPGSGQTGNSDSGAILRCFPDGSGLEVFATGLRNPKGLAFSDRGDLFTTDCDSGHGDWERLVHVVDGGDSGWRSGYNDSPLGPGGPWMSEGLWKPRFGGQAAYALPPVCNIEDDPSGLCHHPGTGLSGSYAGAFFACHRGDSRGASGLQTYSLKPDGTGFAVVDSQSLLRGVRPVDVAFGADSRLYFSDWAEPGRGGVFAIDLSDPNAPGHPAREETGRLLTEGMAGRSPRDLAGLLGHPDQRVRLAAQFELAGRGETSLPVFQAAARDKNAPLPGRLHALWGMGQLAVRVPGALNDIPALLQDEEPEVRAQAAMLIGEYFRIESFRFLVTALQDPEPRVAFFAAQSLGKLRRKDAIPALLELLRRNDDEDATLRHAVVVALARLGPSPALAATAEDPSRPVRLGGLLAYRRMRDPAVAAYLEDFDPSVVREAARAINDVPIEEAMPALAALLERAPLDDAPLVLRAINAHFRLGATENARALADFAGRSHVPASFRAEAIRQLGAWANPPSRDRIVGAERPLPPRDPEVARQAFGAFLSQLAGKAPEELQVATIESVTELRIPGTGHALWDVVYQESHPVSARIAALQALEKLDDLRLEVAAQTAGKSRHTRLRLAALPVLGRRHPAVSLPTLRFLAVSGTPAEQRIVFSMLAEIDDPRADGILAEAIRRIPSGGVPVAAQAELLDAAGRKGSPEVGAALQELHDGWLASGDRLAPYRSALEGGDARAGRQLFDTQPVVACYRCHETDADGRGAGPSLAGIGMLQTPERLLESILFSHAATVTRMPESFAQSLSRMQLRDLIAFLSGLRDPTPGAPDQPRALRSADAAR